jgi:hypothetical protein
LSEQLLPHRHQQQRQFRGDDREQMTSARRAAEALFTPKPELDVRLVAFFVRYVLFRLLSSRRLVRSPFCTATTRLAAMIAAQVDLDPAMLQARR